MAVRTPIDNIEGIYFITFTCQQWHSLFDIMGSYDTVYDNWKLVESPINSSAKFYNTGAQGVYLIQDQ